MRKGYGRRYALSDSVTKGAWPVVFEGNYKNVMNGKGRLELSNGDIFEGEFHQGYMKEGILIRPNGESIKVRYNYLEDQ